MLPMIVFRVIIYSLLTNSVLGQQQRQLNDCTVYETVKTGDKIFGDFCWNTFCDCFSPIPNATCLPRWTRDFAQGIAAVFKWHGITKDFNTKGCYNIQKVFLEGRPYSIYDSSRPYTYGLLRFRNRMPAERPQISFISPDYEFDLNNTAFKPNINAKGIFEIRLFPKKDEIVTKAKDYYSSSYIMYSPDDPLFDTLVMGKMEAKMDYVYYGLNKYYNQDNKDISNIYFQAVDLKDNFELKFNPWVRGLRYRKVYQICLGNKHEPQTGRKYWTTEGCRSVWAYQDYKSLNGLYKNFELICMCDFDSLGLDPIEPPIPTTPEQTTTQPKETSPPTTMEVPKMVEGFNFPDGIPRPRKWFYPTYATKFTVGFVSTLMVIILVLIVLMIATIVYFLYYK